MFGRHVKTELSAYAHGELRGAGAARVARHLEECARCRKEFAEINFGIALAESLPLRAAPAALWDGIETALAGGSARKVETARRDFPSRANGVEATAARRGSSRAGLGFNPLAGWRGALVACSLLAFLTVGGLFWLYRGATRGNWEVASLAGAPTINRERVSKGGRLGVGEWLETDANSRARIKVADIGRVEIDPGTRLRLVETKPTEHRIELARGRMHAQIWAPPRLFFVDTPSAIAADLGCAYTLEVDDAGRGTLRVTSGWVALETKGADARESVVPTGAACVTQPGTGPGTPYFEDAGAAFVAALSRFDFARGGADSLTVLLNDARPRDTLTLWHLLVRTSGTERVRVFDRLAQLAPPPANVTRAGVLALDRAMLDDWKGALESLWSGDTYNIKGSWRRLRGWLDKKPADR